MVITKVAFLLFLICLAAALVSGVLRCLMVIFIFTICALLIIVINRCLASRSFHPTESLFKPKPPTNKRESDLHTSKKNEGFEIENSDD